MAVTANRGFKNIYLFERTGTDTDGYPLIGEGFLLGKANEINNKALSLSDTVQEQSFEADDIVEIQRTVTNKTGTLTVYNVDKASLVSLGLYEEDTNGNLVEAESNKRFAMFFETEKSDGTVIQHWFYDVAIAAAPETYESFNGTNAQELALPITVYKSSVMGKNRFKVNVYKGNTGFSDVYPPATLYKPTATI